jgi:hypothetical protein
MRPREEAYGGFLRRHRCQEVGDEDTGIQSKRIETNDVAISNVGVDSFFSFVVVSNSLFLNIQPFFLILSLSLINLLSCHQSTYLEV